MQMHPRIIFISFDHRIIRPLQDAFQGKPNITFSISNVRDMEIIPGTMFMSPANSIGFMDGGIDAAYSMMFPWVQMAVQEKIKDLGKLTGLGRYYLSVGSAVVVPVSIGCTLASAPTMFLPHDVSKTRNAYHAMMATLMAFKKQDTTPMPMHTLVATGLCCGYGKMDPTVSAQQIRQAYDDFTSGAVPVDSYIDPSFVITNNRDSEQPRNFDNREIHEENKYFIPEI